MGYLVKKNVVKRDKGLLYYINKAGDLMAANMKHGGKKRSKGKKRR